jgi:hypothetical protein
MHYKEFFRIKILTARAVEKKALFLLKTLELLNRPSDLGEPF